MKQTPYNISFIIFVLILVTWNSIVAQDYSVVTFDIMPTDLTARTNARVDANGRPCAVIKVYVNDAITATSGPVIGEIVDRGLEKWVYVAHDAKKIELLFKEHMPLIITFNDFNYPTLTGQMTYAMKLYEEVLNFVPSSSIIDSNPTQKDFKKPDGVFSSSDNLNSPSQKQTESESIASEPTETKQVEVQADTSHISDSRILDENAVFIKTNYEYGYENGHEWVDLGLPSGLKWATCNVGASSPEEYGDYFSWGDTKPKDEYTEKNCFTYGKSASELRAEGIIDYQGSLTCSYDAACINWGGSWRMPTDKDFQELIENCKWKWTKFNGKEGYKITGPNGKSIFFPPAGYRYGKFLDMDGGFGRVWCATIYDENVESSRTLYFDRGNQYMGWYNRRTGRSIRPVKE